MGILAQGGMSLQKYREQLAAAKSPHTSHKETFAFNLVSAAGAPGDVTCFILS